MSPRRLNATSRGSLQVKYYEEAKRNAPMFCRVPTSVAYSTVETNLLRNGSTGATGTTFGLQGVNLDDSGLNYQWKRMPDDFLPGWRYNPTADSGLAPNFCESARTYTGPTTQVPGLVWDGWVFQVTTPRCQPFLYPTKPHESRLCQNVSTGIASGY